MDSHQKVYFASDQHFGAPTAAKSAVREQLFVQWLDQIKEDATCLFLVGDLFDFWFEYKTVVPKGFIRVLGKIAELRDMGIPIHFFVGNHDLWMQDYFEKELSIPVYHEPKEFTFGEHTFYIGHGDGLGPGDFGYKRLKKLFTHPISKWLFRWLHPDIGMAFGQYLSVKNKMVSGDEDIVYLGEDKEWLILHAKDILAQKHYNYFVFGHRHLPMKLAIGDSSEYVNLGDWISYFTYGVYDGKTMEIQDFKAI